MKTNTHFCYEFSATQQKDYRKVFNTCCKNHIPFGVYHRTNGQTLLWFENNDNMAMPQGILVKIINILDPMEMDG